MTTKDWIWLVFELGAVAVVVVAFVWKAVRQPLEYKIEKVGEQVANGLTNQGERIGRLELQCQAHATSIEELKRYDQQHSFEIASNNKEMGRLEGMMQRIERHLEKQSEVRVKEDTELKERLARIETSVQVFSQIRDVLVMAVRSNRQRGEDHD